MIIYPEIAIKNGKCVTLRKGQMTLPVVYDHDPLSKAREFADQGAEWLHVVDLDAVGRHEKDNSDMIAELIRSVPVPVQVGGGIHKLRHVDWWMDRGAECVVMGSAAYLGPRVLREAAERYPFRVLLSVDVQEGQVMVDGWTRPTGLPPLDFARRFDDIGLGGIIVTDIDYDIDLPDASLSLVTHMARNLTTPVIASGVAKSLDHLSTLRFLENIAGAVIGRALHRGDFTLEAALRLIWEVSDPNEAWWRDTADRPEFPDEPAERPSGSGASCPGGAPLANVTEMSG